MTLQLRRIGDIGQEAPVAIDESGRSFDLRPVTADIDGAFLSSGGIEVARDAIQTNALPAINVAGRRIGAPIARPPAVICVGQNYAAHAAETGDAPPEQPIIFFKHPNTVVGPNDPIVMPRMATSLDWEVELGVVIGRTASYLSDPAAARNVIAGFVVSHDVSERVFQTVHSGGQWSKGKTARSFNPLGPALVPADELDASTLRLWSRVNGEPRQDSTTTDMIFSVEEIVHHLSQYMVLEPGDLINTGTPQGVAMSGRFPYLRSGDEVEIGIEGLGAQRSVIVSDDLR